MPQRLNHQLMCPGCGVIYLHIPSGVTNSTVIHCSTCNQPLGTWFELETSLIDQGGVFEMHDGQIIRRN